MTPRPLRVQYDDQIFLRQRRGGISRYFLELIAHLNLLPGLEGFLPLVLTQNEQLLAGAPPGRRPLPSVPKRLVLGRAVNAVAARRVSSDVVHHTFYDPSYLKDLSGKPRVTTVHDMIPELLPQHGDPMGHLAKRAFCEQSDLVVCVSAATRSDLLEVYGVLPGRVEVVPLGVGLQFFGTQTAATARPYVLHVGDRAGYKGFATLLSAVAELPADLHDIELLAVGGGPLTVAERAQVLGLGLNGRVQQKDVSEQELVACYRSALAYVSPSHAEGFGLPVLEAMASGCRVLLRDIPVYREIVGPAPASFFASDDDLPRALEGLIRVQDPSAHSADRREHAAAHSWGAHAKVMAGLYGALVNR